MGAGGQGLRQLTQPGLGESDSDPTFAASGEAIIFSRSDRVDSGNLYFVAVDGSYLHQLTSGRGVDANPAASPSGR
jgi:Tol biopolymer transport system component